MEAREKEREREREKERERENGVESESAEIVQGKKRE